MAPTWLFETVQLMFVSVAALAEDAMSASSSAASSAAPARSGANRLRGRICAQFGLRAFISFLSGRRPAEETAGKQ